MQNTIQDPSIEQIREILASHGWVASLWHTDDVKNVRPDLTDEQAIQVLERCINKHEADIGINWLDLQITASDLFPEDEEEENMLNDQNILN